ncbi:MAG: hypothetical protein JST75_05295 [Bacteroidetes bacterium]|nr:hypothetical protein [Bacteroidota bacterium]
MNKFPRFLKFSGAIIFSLVLAITGCKKTNDANNNGSGSGDYYLRFKADGQQKEYKSEALIQILKKTDGLYSAVLQGYLDFAGQGTKDEFGIIVQDSNPIMQGSSFADPQKCINEEGDTLTKLIMNYNDPSKNGYLSMGFMADKNGVNPLFPSVVADAKLTISELTSDHAKGTFSATVYLSTDVTLTANVKITSGEFYLKRLQ